MKPNEWYGPSTPRNDPDEFSRSDENGQRERLAQEKAWEQQAASQAASNDRAVPSVNGLGQPGLVPAVAAGGVMVGGATAAVIAHAGDDGGGAPPRPSDEPSR